MFGKVGSTYHFKLVELKVFEFSQIFEFCQIYCRQKNFDISPDMDNILLPFTNKLIHTSYDRHYVNLYWSLYQLFHMSNPDREQPMEVYSVVNVVWNFAPLGFESLLLLEKVKAVNKCTYFPLENTELRY